MITFLLAFICTSSTPSFQISDSTPLKSKIYLVKINKNTSTYSFDYLQGISDNSVHTNVVQRPYGYGKFDKTFPFQDITNLSVHRKGSVGRGVALGGLGGTIAGGIAGAISYTPCNCWIDFGVWFDIIGGAAIGLLSGVIIGMVVGSTRKHRFAINGMKENFEKMRAKLLRAYGSTDNQ